MSLEQLPDDILIDIFGLLKVRDLLTARKTSQRFSALSRHKHVWYLVFIRQVVASNLPVPGHLPHLYTTSATDLERRTVSAIRLDRKWAQCSSDGETSSLRLSPRRNIALVKEDGPMLQVLMIPGGQRLVSVHDDKMVSWAVDETTGSLNRLGEWRTPCSGCKAILDTSSEWDTIIAVGPGMQSEFPTTILALTDDHELDVFDVLGQIPTAGEIVSLHGDIISFNIKMEGAHLGILLKDWTVPQTGQTGALLLQLNEHCGDYLGMRYYEGHVVVVWAHAIGMYDLPPVSTEELCCHTPVVVFGLGEEIEGPVAFTSCSPRGLPSYSAKRHRQSPASSSIESDSESDCGSASAPNNSRGSSPTDSSNAPQGEVTTPLTILARPVNPRSTLCQILISACPSVSDTNSTTDPTFAPTKNFRLIRSSPSGPPSTQHPARTLALCLGASGRGIRIDDTGSLYRCVPRRVLSAYGVVDSTVDFHPNQKICEIPLAGIISGHDDDRNLQQFVGFDDSMGRLVFVDSWGSKINVFDFA